MRFSYVSICIGLAAWACESLYHMRPMGLYDRDYIRGNAYGSHHRGMKPRGISFGWSVNTWLIAICVGIFVIDGFISPNSKQFPDPNNFVLAKWLYMSTDHAIWGLQYWRFIGFQFLHASMSHLLFNMIGLYFFGPMVEQHLGGKRYLAFYLLCGIFGAVLYLILNLAGVLVGSDFPGLLFNDTATPLVGASAGVVGILLAGAYLAPNVKVLVFFILPMKLATMAYLLVALAMYKVLFGGNNAGGEAAHLGGAAAGWYFIRNPRHLTGFFDFLGKADPTSEHFALRRGKHTQQDIDRILDKIHQKGLQSLTSKEKKILHEASRTRREGQ